MTQDFGGVFNPRPKEKGSSLPQVLCVWLQQADFIVITLYKSENKSFGTQVLYFGEYQQVTILNE